ncbi:hypothetical protein, partial [Rhizobium leguminosarum]|uniref:hypothetical protein n=1 Tax=Rhizobium leguminosarum TaxID=384 RepID=UPI003F95C4A9
WPATSRIVISENRNRFSESTMRGSKELERPLCVRKHARRSRAPPTRRWSLGRMLSLNSSLSSYGKKQFAHCHFRL